VPLGKQLVVHAEVNRERSEIEIVVVATGRFEGRW
jgi:hypothetical protein